MFGLNIWDFLGILAIICLIISFAIGRNAIWAGLMFGVIMGTIAGLISLMFGKGFYWPVAKQIFIVSVLAGALFEIIRRLVKPPKNSAQ